MNNITEVSLQKRTVNHQLMGAVLVIGGGIGGMQAALDLANSGFMVYLVETASAIGGTMAQLDKTFPTNDCAMCIMSPRLVECSRHRNIEIITCADVLDLQGRAGHFTATVRQRPRYIDVGKCTGCGDCATVCPVRVPDTFNQGLSTRKAAYRLYPQATPNAYTIEKRGTSPCHDACPAGQRAQGYIALIREKRYEDALRVIKEDNPFPAVCGRICNHPCEDVCNRRLVDEPIAIASLKRFVVDQVYDTKPPAEVSSIERKHPERVAIVGSGPAGLTAARDLAVLGYEVTVFEALTVAGGMMRVGVPPFRLPPHLLQREIDEIISLGVELKLNSPVVDAPAFLTQGYQAVFLAAGAHRGAKLPIPGADASDVFIGTDLLRRINLGGEVKIGEQVLVVGGGNVAIDVARTVHRLGAKQVHLACLESWETMPAHHEEIAKALREGIVIHPGRSLTRILQSKGKVTGVECLEVTFMQFDATGRLTLETRVGSEETLSADTVIFAIGQTPDVRSLDLEAKLALTPRGTIQADPKTLQTNLPGVFAGGDVVTGTAFVADAIAAGHRAAESIHAFLRGEPYPTAPEKLPVAEITREEIIARLASRGITPNARATMSTLPEEEGWHLDQEVELGFTEAQALAEAERCLLCGICSECHECVRACQRGAVDHTMLETQHPLEVGAVILATGSGMFDAVLKGEYGYGHYPNVLTNLEFERMLSASGPFEGHVKRPSDGAAPQRLAFIQCVGSRDASCGQEHCSAICCMSATKEAMVAKEHLPKVEATIFFMDQRTPGKGFFNYWKTAAQEHGVRYIRCMVSSVKQVPQSKNLRIRYLTEDGQRREEEFDLVVLSTGFKPKPEVVALAQRLGVNMDPSGFCHWGEFTPSQTSRPGVFVCGNLREPTDIPGAVVSASAAASEAASLLASARHSLTRLQTYPNERDVSQEWPHIGVFICRCGINIAGVVRVPEVVEYAQTLPWVVYAEENLYTCSQDAQERIKEKIKEHHLNRVVVASCTPRTHEPLFQDTIRQVGLNPYLFELANIREQDAWVHRDGPDEATEKAKDLVAMAVSKARLLRPIQRNVSEVQARALVIGGGLAGMTAALSLADQGFPVYLMEKEGTLGGNLRQLHHTMGNSGVQDFLNQTIERLMSHPFITPYLGTQIKAFGGYVGNFHTTIAQENDGVRVELEHGVVLVCTGGQPIVPTEYLYGQDQRVITQTTLEERLATQGDALPTSVIMIQCVGSREDARPYCSKVCCIQAIKNALILKDRRPQTQVYVLHRDIVTPGLRERYYQRAREAGVVFLRYDEQRKPTVAAGGEGLQVRFHEVRLNRELTLNSELLVLSPGIVPNDNAPLAQLLKAPLNQEGFFLEAHAKLRPVDFAADGIFLAGLAHSPQFIEETIMQAQAAASRAATILSQKTLEAAGITVVVNERLCSGCGICTLVCPYDARQMDEERHVSRVIDVLCQGCGACAAACPNGATQQRGFEKKQVYSMVEAALD